VLMQVLGDDDPAPPPNRATEPVGGPVEDGGGNGASRRLAAARPETVVVVLNGTTINQLAANKREVLIERGYSDEEGMVRTDDATDQARQDSLVLFSSGAQRQARDVAGILDIDSVERIDPDTQELADLTNPSGELPAEITIILGTDQAP
jgi:LytR cell envelope-related transcriptional attenuator